MINEKHAKLYCCEDISKIYGYKEAVADKEKMWNIHHCLGLVWTVEQLIEMGLYYKQPAEYLMFVTPSDHTKLHYITKPIDEKWRKNNSIAHKGQVAWNKGKKMSKEFCEKVSKGLIGNVPWNKGMRGVYVATEETKRKQAISQINHPKKSKKVYQYTKDGVFVKEWCSLSEIERVLGFNLQNISKCCLGKIKSAYDYFWTYQPITQ